MRFRAEDLRPHGWRPSQTLQIPDWCGCSIEYLPVPTGRISTWGRMMGSRLVLAVTLTVALLAAPLTA
jgi:hypothetical protein